MPISVHIGTSITGRPERRGLTLEAFYMAFGRFHPGYWYPSAISDNDGVVTPTQNWELAVPFVVAMTSAFDRISLEVTTAVASTTIRLGIREDSGTGRPSTLIVDAGTIDSSTTGAKTLTISQTLNPGLYWLTSTLQGGTGVGCRGRSRSAQIAHDSNGNANVVGWYMNNVTGALSASYTATGSSQAGPKIMLRSA